MSYLLSKKIAAAPDDDGGMSSKWGEGEQGGDQVFWPVMRVESKNGYKSKG